MFLPGTSLKPLFCKVLFAAVAFAVSSIGCTGDEPAPEPDVHADLPFAPAGPNETQAPDPAKMGPYAVGVRTLTFYDDTRSTNDSGEPRKLIVEIWYPSTEDARGATEDYLLWDLLNDEQKLNFDPEDLGAISTEALRDAPVRDNEKYPVLLFSHGNDGIRMQSTYYTNYLASHGYVVVSPDHEGDTLVEMLDELQAEGDNITSTTDSYTDTFFDRPIDMSYLINQLEDLDVADPLKAVLDLEHIGISGHSFGALTSFRTAGFDYRIDALVAQAPVGVGLVNLALDVQVADMGIPYMIQSAGMDLSLEESLHAESLWNHMVPPRFSLSLTKGGHYTYSDLCILDVEALNVAIERDVWFVLTDGCGEENIAPADAFPIIRHYGIGFFNHYLRGSPGSLDLILSADKLPTDIALDAADIAVRAEPE
ncbi:MAG: hypothetical protein GY822_18575 [Deltaproteobacteria bacterium]|nr:hypothetical protein [Deltaproteobacteria bacterium]